MFSSGIGQATGLGATSSVATSAPQNTAEQALSGIAITHGSMDKAFDLKPCDFLDPADLRKAQRELHDRPPVPSEKLPHTPL